MFRVEAVGVESTPKHCVVGRIADSFAAIRNDQPTPRRQGGAGSNASRTQVGRNQDIILGNRAPTGNRGPAGNRGSNGNRGPVGDRNPGDRGGRGGNRTDSLVLNPSGVSTEVTDAGVAIIRPNGSSTDAVRGENGGRGSSTVRGNGNRGNGGSLTTNLDPGDTRSRIRQMVQDRTGNRALVNPSAVTTNSGRAVQVRARGRQSDQFESVSGKSSGPDPELDPQRDWQFGCKRHTKKSGTKPDCNPTRNQAECYPNANATCIKSHSIYAAKRYDTSDSLESIRAVHARPNWFDCSS